MTIQSATLDCHDISKFHFAKVHIFFELY